jgi:hypothetical protein
MIMSFNGGLTWEERRIAELEEENETLKARIVELEKEVKYLDAISIGLTYK